MKSIDKLIIDNFQSYEHTEINFQNFVAIIGASDKGKTAIIRAINWCLYNLPSGTDFIRHGTNFSRVEIIFSDKKHVVRYRDNTTNRYEIFEDGCESLILEHFGVGPVETVVQFHEMFEVNFFTDKQSLNICQQLEKPFFISETPQSKAQIIGKLSGTDVIDLAIRNTASDLRINKQRKERIDRTLSEIKDQHQKYFFLDDLEKDIEKIEKINSHIHKKQVSKDVISSIYQKYKELTLSRVQNQLVLNSESKLPEIEELIFSIEKKLVRYKTLLEISSNIEKFQEEKNEIREKVKIYEDHPFEAFVALIDILHNKYHRLCDLFYLYENISALQKDQLVCKKILSEEYLTDIQEIERTIRFIKSKVTRYSNLCDIFYSLTKNQTSLKNLKDSLKVSENRYQECLDEHMGLLKEIKICPLCLQKLTTKSFEKIQQDLSEEV